MSFTRLHNDECEFDQYLKQSTSVLDHQIVCDRFYNKNNCVNNEKKVSNELLNKSWRIAQLLCQIQQKIQLTKHQ